MDVVQELSIYFEWRRRFYAMLGDFFFTEPTKEYSDEIEVYFPAAKLMGEAYCAARLGEGIELFSSYVWDEGSEDTLAKEFSSIFLVSDVFKGRKPVTPQESVYLSHGGLSMQEERDRVLEKFYESGFKKRDGFTEPEDHIKSEFDFMSVMTERAHDAILKNDLDTLKLNISSQKRFMDEHILRWCYQLCKDVEGRAQSDYFRSMARICAGFVEADAVFMQELSLVLSEE